MPNTDSLESVPPQQPASHNKSTKRLKPNTNPRRGSRGAVSVVDLAKTTALLKSGYTHDQIARLFGVNRRTVTAQINTYLKELDNLDFYKSQRADIMTIDQMRIRKFCLTDEKLKKASAYQGMGMMNLSYNSERLERDKSTQNISYADMSRDLGEMMRESKQLRAELGITDSFSVGEQGEHEITGQSAAGL